MATGSLPFPSADSDGGVVVRYLGQSGFLLRHGGVSIVIDPYLSYAVDRLSSDGLWKRQYPPPVRPEELTGVDLVLCTHDHLDHTEPETLRGIAAASPQAQFAGPRASVERIRGEGIADGATILQDGKVLTFRDVEIEPVSAAHEAHETDADGYDLFLGYLLRWNGLTFYHAGDTVVTPRLTSRLAGQRIDVAFLPINGRSDERRQMGIVGNMNAAEAAQFGASQKFGLVVPVHHDLYVNNGAPVADFVSAWEETPIANRPRFKVFCPGESLFATPTRL